MCILPLKKLIKTAKVQLVINSLKPLIQDLNNLPLPDYDLENHYILYDWKIQRATKEIMSKTLPFHESVQRKLEVGYRTMASRGCPHSCSYCCNSSLKRLYSNQKYLRRRSINNLMDELVQIKEKFPFIKQISFADDTFTGADMNYFKIFSKEYKEKIGLPFRCLTSPVFINEAKMKLLIDAGMYFIGMGIQSGCAKILKLYNRHIPSKLVLDAAKTINKFKHELLPPTYDVLLDCPYENEDNVLETLNLVAQLPKPYYLSLYSLVLFPGTDLYELAKRDGFIKDEKKEIYRKLYCAPKQTYLNFLFEICRNGKLSQKQLNILSNKKMINLFSRPYFNKLLHLLSRGISEKRNISKGIKLICNGDFDNLNEYYRRWKGG